MGTLTILVIVLALCPSQTMATPISVQIQIQPQLSSFLGFYDTLFPLYFAITITNNQANRMPAGNLSLHIEAPSGKYSSWYPVPFPAIESHASATEQEKLEPKEAGLYIFHLDSYDTPAGRISLVGLPLTVVDLRGPENIYSAASAVVSVVSLAVAIVALKKAQEAKNQKSGQLDG